MTLAIGKAVPYPELATPGAPTNEEVNRCWRAYFEALRDLFERRKEGAGFGDWALVLRGIDKVANPFNMLREAKQPALVQMARAESLLNLGGE